MFHSIFSYVNTLQVFRQFFLHFCNFEMEISEFCIAEENKAQKAVSFKVTN